MPGEPAIFARSSREKTVPRSGFVRLAALAGFRRACGGAASPARSARQAAADRGSGRATRESTEGGV